MPITWICPCGKALRVADEYAGRQVKCPVCNGVTTAPQADPSFEVVEDTTALASPPPPPKPAAARVQAVVVSDEDDEPSKKRQSDQSDEDEGSRNKSRDDDGGRPRKRRRDDEDDDRPWKNKGKKSKDEQAAHNPGLEHRVLNGGILGGMLAMLIAVVWFVVGLLNDVIFFYPPILFVIGLVAVIKGATGGNQSE